MNLSMKNCEILTNLLMHHELVAKTGLYSISTCTALLCRAPARIIIPSRAWLSYSVLRMIHSSLRVTKL